MSPAGAAVRTSRASALPADERRAAIVRATLALLLERGAGVTTRQIAEAAGIAEGTIFRVFPDKEAVIRAAVEEAFDTRATEEAIAAVDADLAAEAQLAEAVAIMQRRLRDIWRLVSAVGNAAVADRPPGPPPDLLALAELFRRHPDLTAFGPLKAARALRALTLAVSHPALNADEPMAPGEIVALLLDGIRLRPAAPPTTTPPTTTPPTTTPPTTAPTRPRRGRPC